MGLIVSYLLVSLVVAWLAKHRLQQSGNGQSTSGDGPLQSVHKLSKMKFCLKLQIDSGMVPLIRVFCNRNSLSSSSSPSAMGGIVPVILFPLRYKSLSREGRLKSLGMVPVRVQLCMYTSRMVGISKIVFGIVPPRRFPETSKKSRRSYLSKTSGMVPVQKLLSKRIVSVKKVGKCQRGISQKLRRPNIQVATYLNQWESRSPWEFVLIDCFCSDGDLGDLW